MPTELPKAYEPKDAQAKWLAFWDAKGYFHADPAKPGEAYTIVIPPPNVTGALHMGHALNNTLQDVLVRWRRMQGRNTLWMPGTDHAGIATQAVVERLLLAEDKSFKRREYGREKLVAKIWEWKDKYEARILGQLKQLGASCDWQRTRFTLDDQCARAVRETFFRMFRDGYIYRGKRLVNWDTQLQTSVADDETYTETTKGGFWTFKYEVVSAPGTFVQFSTTRPETMLGDTALCVHPDDERYKALIGKKVLQPHTGREIPIIADALLADPELGTGCVKVTPAHDPNDYACWQRHPHIGIINILNPDGTIAAGFGEYTGLDRAKAREAVAAKMEELGLFVDKADRHIPLPFSDRSKTPIEPFLSDQWFVRMGESSSTSPLEGEVGSSEARTGRGVDGNTPLPPTPAESSTSPSRGEVKKGLAQLAMDAVTSGQVRFFPERYAKTYLDWLGEKRDWCISRQLWWGHRIPVWSKTVRVPELNALTGAGFGLIRVMADDSDVLESGLALDSKHSQFAALQINLQPGGLVQLLLCVAPGHDEFQKRIEEAGFEQDPDVLDTWFSSALWPHSTLGWPEPTPELARYYPTNTLCTSRDIISLWVARMVLMGQYNLGEVPFRDVYIHPQLQDGFGDRMNKTAGNGIDPLDIIERYGTDALRYYAVSIAGETQDARLPVSNVCPHCDALVPTKPEHLRGRTKKLTCPTCKQAFRPGGPWPSDDPDLPTAKQASDRFELGRNFANKLWNATRFILMNLDSTRVVDSLRESASEQPLSERVAHPTEISARAAVSLRESAQTPALGESGPPYLTATEDRWIVSRLATTAAAVTAALEAYKFADVARLVYEFAWSEFCDWYIEMSKSRRSDPACQRVLVGVLDGILRLVHPVMPFVAESLWQYLNEAAPVRGLPHPQKAEESVAIAKWPTYPAALTDASTEAGIARMQALVRGVRELRNRYQIDKAPLALAVKCSGPVAADLIPLTPFVVALGGLSGFECGPGVVKPPQAGSVITPEFEAYIPLAGLIDPAAERKRIEKHVADIQKQLAGMTSKLGNAKYVANAPPEVVQETRAKVAELEAQVAVLEGNAKDLG